MANAKETPKSFEGQARTVHREDYSLGDEKFLSVNEKGDLELFLSSDEIRAIITIWDDGIFEDFVHLAREARARAKEKGSGFRTPISSLDPDLEYDEEDEEDY